MPETNAVTLLSAYIRPDQRERLTEYQASTGKISTSEAVRDLLDKFFASQDAHRRLPDPEPAR